ncbi:MAG: GHKL domain-containing protein, partial [Lentisphaerae bacterium]
LNLISGADPRTLETICSTLQNQRRIFIECYCSKRDNSVFPAEITVNMLSVQNRESLCFFIRNISSRIKTQEALREAQKELVETAHRAGMAEIATSILHDVGNLLNSVNVSCEMIDQKLTKSTIGTLLQVTDLIKQQDDPVRFFSEDPRGKRIPHLLIEMGQRIQQEQAQLKSETGNLRNKIALIREVIQMQQSYAKAGLFEEEANVEQLVDDAIAIHSRALKQAQIKLNKKYRPVPHIRVAKSKFVHVILNLIKNAEEAVSALPASERRIDVEIFPLENEICVKISDNGVGIDPEDLGRIFTHGFTTKATGHGFGLHSCANMIKEMGGRIEVESAGRGRGASFSVIVPQATKK